MEKKQLKSIIQKERQQGRKKEEILFFARKNNIADSEVNAIFAELEKEKIKTSFWYPWGEEQIDSDFIETENKEREKKWELYKNNPDSFLKKEKRGRNISLFLAFIFLCPLLSIPFINIFFLLLLNGIIQGPKEYKNLFENDLIFQKIADKKDWVFTDSSFLTQHGQYPQKIVEAYHQESPGGHLAFLPVYINRKKWSRLSTQLPEIYNWQQNKEKILKLNRAEFSGEIIGDIKFKDKNYHFWLSEYKIRDFINKSPIPRTGLFLALKLDKPLKNEFEIETETSGDRFMNVLKGLLGLEKKEIETESMNFNRRFAFRYNGQKKDYENSIVQVLSPILQEKLYNLSQKEQVIKPINFKFFFGGLALIFLLLLPVFFLPMAGDLQTFLTQQDISAWQKVLGTLALYVLGIASVLAIFSVVFSLTWVPLVLFILYKKIKERRKKSLHIVFKKDMIFIQLKKPLLQNKKTNFSKSMDIVKDDLASVEKRIQEVLSITVPMLKYLD